MKLLVSPPSMENGNSTILYYHVFAPRGPDRREYSAWRPVKSEDGGTVRSDASLPFFLSLAIPSERPIVGFWLGKGCVELFWSPLSLIILLRSLICPTTPCALGAGFTKRCGPMLAFCIGSEGLNCPNSTWNGSLRLFSLSIACTSRFNSVWRWG